MKSKKVIRLTHRQRVQVTTVKEAMSEAIAVLGGEVRVRDVVKFVQRHYGFRGWSDRTIYSYFSLFSRPRSFDRIRRGVYRNHGRPVKRSYTRAAA